MILKKSKECVHTCTRSVIHADNHADNTSTIQRGMLMIHTHGTDRHTENTRVQDGQTCFHEAIKMKWGSAKRIEYLAGKCGKELLAASAKVIVCVPRHQRRHTLFLSVIKKIISLSLYVYIVIWDGALWF